MCGIFAYLNYKVERERRYIVQVLFNCLRRLEYRGYDSAGIAIDSSSSSPPIHFRQEGNIDSLVKSVYQEFGACDVELEESFKVHAGIAHTRWATHGEPSPRNSLPQSSGPCHHFLVLRQTLLRHGFTFESDSDTAVIPKLAKFVFDKANEAHAIPSFISEVYTMLIGATIVSRSNFSCSHI